MSSNHQGGHDERSEVRLFAYALGQLEGREKAAAEAELAVSETARRAVQEIQALAQQVRAAHHAATLVPSAALRAAVEARLHRLEDAAKAPQSPPEVVAVPARAERTLRRWPIWAMAAAAACVLIGAGLLFVTRGGRGVPGDGMGMLASSPSTPVMPATVAGPVERGAKAGGPGAGGPVAPPAHAAPIPRPDMLAAKGTANEPRAQVRADSKTPSPSPPSKEAPPAGAVAAKDGSGGAEGKPAEERLPDVPPEFLPPGMRPVESLAGAQGAKDKPSPRVVRGARTRKKHIPGKEPWFIAPPGAAGPALTNIPPLPIDVPAPLEPEGPTEAKQPDARSGLGGFGAGAVDPGAGKSGPGAKGASAGSSGNGKQAGPKDSHLALTPGMRPEAASGPDAKRAGSGKTLLSPAGEAARDAWPETMMESPFVAADKYRFSAFSLETGAGAYPTVARSLGMGHLPRADRVQIEEMVNYFRYDYAQPGGDAPFAIHVDAAECPWNHEHRLVRVAIVARRAAGGAAGSGVRAEKSGEPALAARDVQVQVEFNPGAVEQYRLIGYEEPASGGEEPEGPAAMGGDLRPGHTATALYEVMAARSMAPAGPKARPTKAARTQGKDLTAADAIPVLLTVRLRYQRPDTEQYRLMVCGFVDPGQSFAGASADFRFAAAVAAFGMVLRRSEYRGNLTLQAVEEIAANSRGRDAGGQRAEFVELVRQARRLGAGP